MKNVLIICIAAVVFFVPAFVLASSCGSEGDDGFEGEGYFIKFKEGEQEYNLTYGFSDVESGEPFAIVIPGGSAAVLIMVFASSVESDSTVVREELDDVIDVTARLYPHTGEFEDDYDAATNSVNSFCELDIYISENSNEYLYGSTSGTVTITSFGAEGEAVEGTFSITFEGGMEPAALGDPTLDVTGEFRLKHLPLEVIPI
jgi:hypothetical protein